jgi:hypothetical protein
MAKQLLYGCLRGTALGTRSGQGARLNDGIRRLGPPAVSTTTGNAAASGAGLDGLGDVVLAEFVFRQDPPPRPPA